MCVYWATPSNSNCRMEEIDIYLDIKLECCTDLKFSQAYKSGF